MKRGNEQSWWYVLTGGEPRQDRECKITQEKDTLWVRPQRKETSVRKLGVGLFGHSSCYSRHSHLTLKGIIYWKEIWEVSLILVSPSNVPLIPTQTKKKVSYKFWTPTLKYPKPGSKITMYTTLRGPGNKPCCPADSHLAEESSGSQGTQCFAKSDILTSSSESLHPGQVRCPSDVLMLSHISMIHWFTKTNE